DRIGRWVLVAATLAGWALGVWVALPPIAVGALFAFVGGAIMLVSLKEELPEERQSNFVPFLIGAVLYSVRVLAREGWVGRLSRPPTPITSLPFRPAAVRRLRPAV
ncbi:MAG: hypothetical protein ACR2FJ_04950, partial [Qipengyuania sp.]